MTASFSDPRPVIRPALPLDREAVLEFCKFIWEGHDYIPYVWDEWMADPDGEMFVAEYAGKAVGLGRLTLLAPGQWWLEGLRVDPAHQDRKIGSLMNEYLNALWLERGDGIIRLMTSSQRAKVHHMAEQHGFAHIGERMFFSAKPDDSAGMDATFAKLKPAEVPEAVAFALAADSTTLTGPLADVGWRFATPSVELFSSFMGREDSHLYWWRGRDGLLLGWEDEWDEGRHLLVALAACRAEVLSALFLDLRRLAAERGIHAVGWNANLQPEMAALLAEVGFARESEHSAYLFERRHPTRP